MDPRDGKMAGTLIPVAIFTQIPWIVADANPRLEEPDAVIPHVRVCGGPGSQRPGPTRRGWTATCRSHSSKGTLGHRAPASRSEPIDYLVGHGDKGATEPAGSGFPGVWRLRSSVLSVPPWQPLIVHGCSLAGSAVLDATEGSASSSPLS